MAGVSGSGVNQQVTGGIGVRHLGGASINAPERFLQDPRNRLFNDYVRFLEEFAAASFLFENAPGLLSLADGKVFDQILAEFRRLGSHVILTAQNDDSFIILGR